MDKFANFPILVTPDKMLLDINLGVSVEDGNVLLLTVGGNVTDDHMDEFSVWANLVHTSMLELTGKTGQRALTLIDVSHLHEFDIKTTTIVHDLMVSDKDIAGRTAIFGANYLAMTMLQAIIALTKRKNIKLFDTRERAIAWLQSEPPELLRQSESTT